MWGTQSIKGTFRGIGAFVLVLALAIGVVGYIVTRPPSKELSAEDRAWVPGFEAWVDATEGRVNTAIAGLTFESSDRNTQLIEPLATCSMSLLRMGEPSSELLTPAYEAAQEACGRAEHAVGVNDAFGTASLATTRLHLDEAGDRLELARRNLSEALTEANDA
jgi:hypothetical protein